MDRRHFIRTAAGGLIVAAGAPLAGCADPVHAPASATEAWRAASAETEPRRRALAWALLAPNPHNMQPWVADLGTAGEIRLFLDRERLLPATDPFSRQILMGAGCFLELLALAAAADGRRAQIALFPEGEYERDVDARPFAQVRLLDEPGLRADSLFAQVAHRRTDRRAYDPSRTLTPDAVAALKAAVPADSGVRLGLAGIGATGAAGAGGDDPAADRARVEALRRLTREAWRIEATTEGPMMESLRVLRVGAAEIDRHRDGITVEGLMPWLLTKAGLFDRTRFPAPDSTATRQTITAFDEAANSTPAYLWLVTEGNRRSQQVAAGRAYARVALAGTGAGLVMHPNEQALQEYPQMAEPYRAVHALLDAPAPAHTVQMLARVGYLPAGTPAAGPAPRRGLAAQLRA